MMMSLVRQSFAEERQKLVKSHCNESNLMLSIPSPLASCRVFFKQQGARSVTDTAGYFEHIAMILLFLFVLLAL